MKQINEGQIFKNYKKLCEYLEEQVKTGKSKQLQLKDWSRYFTWHNEGNKFVIDKVFDEPIQKQRQKCEDTSKYSSNNNKNITPMMDYLTCISDDICAEVPYTFTAWFCDVLKLMDKDTYNAPYSSDEVLKAFCTGHGITNEKLFCDYLAIIKKVTKDIFLKALDVLARKYMAVYEDGYKFYYQIGKEGCIGEIFSTELNEMVLTLEKKNCDILNEEHGLSKKMKGRQLLMLIFKNDIIRDQFDKFVMQDLNNDTVYACLNKSIDIRYWPFICHMDEKHEILRYYRAVSINDLDNYNKDQNADKFAMDVTNVIRRVSRKNLLNKKWRDKDNRYHLAYDKWENATDMVIIEKLLFQNYDETFVDDTSLDLVELDDNLDEIFNGIKDIWGEPNSMEIPVMAQGVDSFYFLNISKKEGGNMRHSGVHYNYDIAESNWIIKQGAKVIGCGRHSTTGNTFLVFQATDLYKKLCEEYRAKHST